MAEVPPGPSSLLPPPAPAAPAAAELRCPFPAGAALACCSEDEEDDEELPPEQQQLCFLAMVGEECVGAIVCKLDMHKKMFRRGYIAMLAVDSKYRRNGIGTNLVKKAIYAMVEGDCDEVVLETEITNKSALKLYENLGFVRDKRLFRYYLNGVDALRLKLWLR